MVGGGPGAFIGAVHRAAIRLNNNADLVCAAEANEKMAKAMGEDLRLDPDRVYDDFTKMAEIEGAREDKIDWVSIVAPNGFHYPAAKAFLLQGINVVCEKPLCFTEEEGDDLKNTAKNNNCLFCVTYTNTGQVMTKQARAMVKKGVIGDIRMVIAEYPQDWMLDVLDNTVEDSRPWKADPRYAGRSACAGDIGTHIENWVFYVSGLRIEKLCCNLDAFGGSPLDNNAEILVKFTNGATGVYWASQVVPGYENALRVRLIGEKGTIEFIQEENNYLKVYLRHEPEKIYSRGCDYLEEEAKRYVRIPCGHPEGLHEAFANIYKDFCRALLDKHDGKEIDEGSYGYPTVDMGIDGVRFTNKCVDSSEAGSIWVGME